MTELRPALPCLPCLSLTVSVLLAGCAAPSPGDSAWAEHHRSAAISALAVEIIEAEAELSALKANHGDDHPRIKQQLARRKALVRHRQQLKGRGYEVDHCDMASKLSLSAAHADAKRAELSVDYAPNHPKVKSASARAKRLERAASDAHAECYLEN